MAYRTGLDPYQRDLQNLYEEEKEDNLDSNSFTGGLEAGIYSTLGSIDNTQAAVQRKLGMDEWAEANEREADEYGARAAGAAHMVPQFDEIDGIGDAAGWAAGALGQNLPLIASTIAGGGAGLGARALGAAAGGMGGRAAAAGALQGTLKGAGAARTAGAAVPYGASTVGGTYSALRHDPDAEGTAEEKAGAALLSGGLQTGLGLMFEPLGIAQKAFGGKLSPAAAFGLGSVGEGVTEVGEQLIQQKTQNLFNPDAGYNPMELMEAGLAGTLIGGAFSAPGAVGGAVRRRRKANLDGKPTLEDIGVPTPVDPATGEQYVPDPREVELGLAANLDDDIVVARNEIGSQQESFDRLQQEVYQREFEAARQRRPQDGPDVHNAMASRRVEADPTVQAMQKNMAETKARTNELIASRADQRKEKTREIHNNLVDKQRSQSPAKPPSPPEAGRSPRELGARPMNGMWVRDEQNAQGKRRIINDPMGKDTLEFNPTLAGMQAGDMSFNGERISTGRVLEAMQQGLDTGDGINYQSLMEAARYSYEFRRRPANVTVATATVPDKLATKRGEKTTFNVEDTQQDLRNHPLWADYGVHSAVVNVEGRGDPAAYGNTVAALSQKMAAQPTPLVMVGSMDNHYYFATKGDRAKFYKDFKISDALKKDVGFFERIGVLLKKESGANHNFNVGNVSGRHDDTTKDGVMYVVKGEPLLQGVSMRKVDDGKGGSYFESDKGMGMSPPQVRDWKVDEDGKLIVGPVLHEEGESLNSKLQLDQTRNEDADETRMTAFSMFPTAREKGGTANMQQALFSMTDPLGFLKRDRLHLNGLDPTSLLTPEEITKHESGVPLPFLLSQDRMLALVGKLQANTARGYVVPSSLVAAGEVQVMPGTYRQLNTKWREQHGRNLMPGDTLVIHRDPALPNATSMGEIKFGGVMTLQAENRKGGVDTGMFVNPENPVWKDAAGDFDGDSGVLMVPDNLMQPLPQRQDASKHPGFVKRGAAKATTLEQAFQARNKPAPGLPKKATPTDAEIFDAGADASGAIVDDILTDIQIGRASEFSTQIGIIMAQALKLAEVGQLDVTVPVSIFHPNTGEHVGYESMTIASLASAVGQGSISAKKKQVWLRQAQEAMELLKDYTQSVRPLLREPDGTPILDNKGEPKTTSYFAEEFNQLKRAPGKAKAKVWAQISQHAEDVITQYVNAAGALKAANGDINGVPQSMRWILSNEARTHVAFAARARAVDRLFKETGAIAGRRELPNAIVQAAKNIVSNQGTKAQSMVSGIRTEYAALAKRLSAIESSSAGDAEREAVRTRMSELVRLLALGYAMKNFTGAEIIAYGPPSAATRIVSAADWQQVHAAAQGSPDPQQLRMEVHQGGRQIHTAQMPADGIYVYQDGHFHEIDQKTWEPTGLSLKQNVSSDLAKAAAEGNVNSLEAVVANAYDGFVRIKVPPSKSASRYVRQVTAAGMTQVEVADATPTDTTPRPDIPQMQAELQASEEVPLDSGSYDYESRATNVEKMTGRSAHIDLPALQRMANTLVELLGLKPVTIINGVELLDMVDRGEVNDPQRTRDETREFVMKKSLKGLHFSTKDGGNFIYIRGIRSDQKGATKMARQAAVLAHELGHHVQFTHWNELLANDPILAGKIHQEFTEWAHANGKDPNTYEGDFNEWFADNVGKWLATDTVPSSIIDQWFHQVAQAIKALHKAFVRAAAGPSESLTQFMRGITDAEAASRLRAGPTLDIEPDTSTEAAEESASTLTPEQTREARITRLKGWAATGTNDIAALRDQVAEITENLGTMVDPKDAKLLREMALHPTMRGRMRTLLGGDPDAMVAIEENPDAAAAYMYALATAGVMHVDVGVKKVFTKVSDILNDVTLIGDVTPGDIDSVVQALNTAEPKPGKPIFPPGSPAAKLYEERAERHARGLAWGMHKMAQLYRNHISWYIDVPYQRMLDTGVPSLIKLARLIQPMAWEHGGFKRSGVLEKMRVEYQSSAAQAADVLGGVSDESRSKVREALYNAPGAKGRLSDTEKETVGRLHKLFDDLWRYERDAGLDVPHRENYFPMVLNHEWIEGNMDAAVEAFTAHPTFIAGWEGIKTNVGERMAAQNPTQREAILKMYEDMSIEEFIPQYLTNKLEASVERQLQHKVHNPGFRFMNPRDLNFLLQSGDADAHAGVLRGLEGDVAKVTERYIRNASRRSEHQRLMSRLGPDGFSTWAEQAAADGATEKDIELAQNYLDAVNGMLGLKERDAIDRKIEENGEWGWLQQFHSKGEGVMNEKLSTMQSWALIFEAVTKLSLNVFSTVIDPLGQLLQTGSGRIFAESMRETRDMMSKTGKANPSERARILRLAGVMEHSFSREDLANTYWSANLSPGAQKVANVFFKYNGVEWMTERSRAMNGFAALSTLEMWTEQSKGTGPEADEAAQRLQEFGLYPDDVQLDEEGKIKILNWDERQMPDDGASAERERDNRVRAAIHRFVDQSSVRPDPTNRPLYSSNPYFALVSQWKTFITAFDNQILRPVWNRLTVEGKATPALWMAMTFIPAMFFADMLRDTVRTIGDSDDDDFRPKWKENWTLADHLTYAVERAGLYGRAELIGNVLNPLMEGKVPEAATEAFGPASGHIKNIAQRGVGEREIPTNDVWRNWG